eukprot:2385237-Alexandrium_andersonii.AAC.1
MAPFWAPRCHCRHPGAGLPWPPLRQLRGGCCCRHLLRRPPRAHALRGRRYWRRRFGCGARPAARPGLVP